MKTPLHMILFKLVSAQKAVIRPRMTQLGLSPGQPKILSLLSIRGDCLQWELARHCDIEPATVSKLLSGMEEAGFITRKPVPGDKRAVLVSLTDKGAEANRQMALYHAQARETAFQGFTPQEEDALIDALCRMYRNLTGNQID